MGPQTQVRSLLVAALLAQVVAGGGAAFTGLPSSRGLTFDDCRMLHYADSLAKVMNHSGEQYDTFLSWNPANACNSMLIISGSNHDGQVKQFPSARPSSTSQTTVQAHMARVQHQNWWTCAVSALRTLCILSRTALGTSCRRARV